ncbi:DUF4258 domain-containing protein [Roseofilum sp. Guam]|uniref:DUF4258 domain-containing protein n=1 Tax=Roseofilum sp. Guam TaxID=2821502 RepID=UPI001B12B9DD|nr:DUF4258 domain-containing protein [Roseofilum sp. Guam]MBP0030902.1 DUF4258 domain-containing protein [Roseofilum sp. Guam]
MDFQFSNHALDEIRKRNIPIALIEAVLASPQQTLKQSEAIEIYQSQLDFGTGKLYLLRVFINITVNPLLVVTVYRTSKIQKYWRNP